MHVTRSFRLCPAPWHAALVLAAAVAAGCGGGATSTTPIASAGPTAPPLPAEGAFSAIGTTSLATAPQTNGTIAVALPSAGPYSGTLSLSAPATIPSGTTLAIALASSNAALGAGVPALALLRTTSRSVQSVAPHSTLFYMNVASSTTFTAPNAPGFTFTVPSGLPSASYYLALYNPLEASLGWQLGFEGPATVGATSLVFAAPNPATPVTFSANVPYSLAVYAVSAQAAAPTPAPATTPAAPPAPPIAFTLSTTAVSLLAPGASATSTIADPSGYTGSYGANSSNASVATATVNGTTVTVTAVAAGSATITVSDAQARTATIAVQVTTTTLPVQ